MLAFKRTVSCLCLCGGTLTVPLRHHGCASAAPCLCLCGTMSVPLQHHVYASATPCLCLCGTMSVPLRHHVCASAAPCLCLCGTMSGPPSGHSSGRAPIWPGTHLARHPSVRNHLARHPSARHHACASAAPCLCLCGTLYIMSVPLRHPSCASAAPIYASTAPIFDLCGLSSRS